MITFSLGFKVLRRALIACLCTLSSLAFAELQPFPYSKVEQQSISEIPDYRLVLSPVGKTNGRLDVSKSRRMNTNLVRAIYEIDDGFEISEVWSFYQQQLQRESAEVWYQCFGRDCGESSLWANDIFNYRRLGGLEKTQNYGVYHWQSSGRSHLAVLYGIVRANTKKYLLVDQLTASVIQNADGPVSKKSDLPERGQVPILIPVSLSASNRMVMTTSARTQVATLSQKLLTMRPKKIFFVGHYMGDEGIETEIERSQQLADQLKEYVMSTVSGLNLVSYGVGPLSPTHPDSAGKKQWVEILVEN